MFIKMAKEGFIGITITNELWKYFNSKKEAGETFEDVIKRVSNISNNQLKFKKGKNQGKISVRRKL